MTLKLLNCKIIQFILWMAAYQSIGNQEIYDDVIPQHYKREYISKQKRSPNLSWCRVRILLWRTLWLRTPCLGIPLLFQIIFVHLYDRFDSSRALTADLIDKPLWFGFQFIISSPSDESVGWFKIICQGCVWEWQVGGNNHLPSFATSAALRLALKSMASIERIN